MNFTAPYSLLGDNVNLELHLHPDHLRDLYASGLRDETIRKAGVYSLAPGIIGEFFRRGKVPPQIETALCFPYQGGAFARIKLFPSLDYLDAKGKRKRQKYSQPSGTSARLYIPFPVEDGPVYVAEGEKKTLAAHQAGLNTVGIGGVWSWLSRGTPIDGLSLIDWQDRDVTIIPDSDVFQRVDLMRAIYALGCEIKKQGADVLVAQIEQPRDAKVGLDDFLLAGGDVDALDVFNLSHRIFKGAAYWHGRWKLTRAMEAA